MSAPRYQKRQLELARQERAAAKRERRRARRADEAKPDAASPPDGDASQLTETQVLEALAELHRQYDAELITLDELESSRAEVLQHLRID